MEIFKLEEEIKIEEKLAAYSAVTIKMEESMQVINSRSMIKGIIDEINSLQSTIEGKINNLKSLHTKRESLESQIFEDFEK